MHSPAALGCGARPNQTLADVVVGVLFARLLGNRHPSPYMYHATFLCLIACVVNTTATSHVAHNRDPSFPCVRYTLSIGFGKHAASCYHLDATQARQGLLKTGPRIGLGKVSGMLWVGSSCVVGKAGFKPPKRANHS
jgi:hypothetical protein